MKLLVMLIGLWATRNHGELYWPDCERYPTGWEDVEAIHYILSPTINWRRLTDRLDDSPELRKAVKRWLMYLDLNYAYQLNGNHYTFLLRKISRARETNVN